MVLALRLVGNSCSNAWTEGSTVGPPKSVGLLNVSTAISSLVKLTTLPPNVGLPPLCVTG